MKQVKRCDAVDEYKMKCDLLQGHKGNHVRWTVRDDAIQWDK